MRPRQDVNINEIGRDPDQLEAFYREHVEAIQRFIARRTSDPYLNADLTSETFLAAIDAANSYDPSRGVPRAWLFGIARNVVNTELRRQGRAAEATRRQHSWRVLDDDALERATERLDAERDARTMFTRIADLPESQRALVELVALDGLALTDAAATLGISPSAARVRYHRARKTLTLPTATPQLTIAQEQS